MKAETAAAKLAAMLGLDAPKPAPTLTPEEQYDLHTNSREAESVATYFKNKGRGFKSISCSQCGAIFTVNRGSVSMCSDECRANHLAAIGIIWNPLRATESERWGGVGQEPLVIGPVATALIQQPQFQAQLTQPVQVQVQRPVPQTEQQLTPQLTAPVGTGSLDDFLADIDLDF